MSEERVRVEEITKQFFAGFKHVNAEIVGFSFGEDKINGINEEASEHYIKLSVEHHSGNERNKQGDIKQ
jgi:hypothetical protein